MIYAIIAIVILCVICALTLLGIFVSKNVNIDVKSKGDIGENFVANILGETIIGQQYVINDLLFKNNMGISCQIDHIFINKFGIWVIETKNYAGQIYGNENQRQWTQVLAYGNKKNSFYNPVKHNATHIYRLSEYLKVKKVFQNIVVFLNNADLTNVSATNIYSVYDLYKIKTQPTNITLSIKKMEYFYNKLLELKINNKITKEDHIHNINEMQNKIHQGICPRCGKFLVLREGKNGQFFGCSSFPKCKFTKNIFD